MEVVQKRQKRQKPVKVTHEEEDTNAIWRHSDMEEKTTVEERMTELDTNKKLNKLEEQLHCDEEDVTTLLVPDGEVASEQELAIAMEGADLQHVQVYNKEENCGENERIQQGRDIVREKRMKTVKTPDRKSIGSRVIGMESGCICAPSAPAFEVDIPDPLDIPAMYSLPNQTVQSSLPPIRTSVPRAFHEITLVDSVDPEPVPVAPLELGDDDVADSSSTTPSATSFSPTVSKKLHRVIVSSQSSEKLSPTVRSPSKSVAAASVEGASVKVRDSLAKSFQAAKQAGMYSIYPPMPRQAIKATTLAAEDRGETHASYQQLLKKSHIHVKLDPFTSYETNLMRAEVSQRRQEMKMRHIETNKGELYARVECYLYSEYILHDAASTMSEDKEKIDLLTKKVWNLERKRVSSSQRCGDNVEIEQQMEFQSAKLETAQLEKLRAHLDKIRQQRTTKASMHTLDRATSYLRVEQYLNRVLQEPDLVMYLNSISSSSGNIGNIDDLDAFPESANIHETLPEGSSLVSSVDHLKYCIDVLIYFEKKVTLEEESAFGRVPRSFHRGELIWHSSNAKIRSSAAGGAGVECKIKCYACGSMNIPMKSSQWCKSCDTCDMLLYLPPSSVSTKTNEWFQSVLRFRQSLQKWITVCVQTLMRTKSLLNTPYLLMHAMYLPRVSTEERSWFLRFLQFPRAIVCTDGSLRNEWSEDLVDHYIAMLHLVFHPEKLRKMSVVVSSGPSSGTTFAKSANVGVPDKKGLVFSEWVLLQNPEMLDRYFLSDEDFVAVLNQFPNTFAFEQLFSCTTDVKKCFSRALTLVLEFTHSCRVFQEFEKLPARIAQLLGQLLLGAAELPGPGCTENSDMKDAIYYPTLFDQLFLSSLRALMTADCNRVAWKGLYLYPYGSLSALAKWDALALLLFNLQSIPTEAKTAPGWMQFIGTSNIQEVDIRAPARQRLYNLINSDTEGAIYVLNAVASLAALCQPTTCANDNRLGEQHDLIYVAVYELFVARYTVESCRHALGGNDERAAVPLSTICLSHTWVLSHLIMLVFKYHQCAATWINVFETFPINRWVPTAEDLLNIEKWLQLEDIKAPRSALARFLLDHINWEYDVKLQRLFTNAMLHRQAALMVSEALAVYKKRQGRGSDFDAAAASPGGGPLQKLEVTSIAESIQRALWLGETVDFEKWCWKLMLKLKFHSLETYEPLLPLIDLRHDRSREALTLRRWFAEASMLPSHNVFPFYTSLEEQLWRSYGHAGNDGSSKMDAEIGGSTGAPIQQKCRTLLTPQNQKRMSRADIVSTTTATAAPQTEPIVAYVICQMTTFMFSDRLDRWEPLLVLLRNSLFLAAVSVLENLFPLLARLDKNRHCLLKPVPASMLQSEDESKTSVRRTKYAGSPIYDVRSGGVVDGDNNDLEACMAAMQAMSTDELLNLLNSLHEFSYINTHELHHMQELLNRGYIGGWERTAKERVLVKLRFVRNCSRFLHPIVLPALINECFPESSTMLGTTSALFHGAISWIASALGTEHSTGASPSMVASSTCAALSIRNSSLTATTTSHPISAKNGFPKSTNLLCAMIRRSFEYSTNDVLLAESVCFWMKSLLHVPFWYDNVAFRHVLDVMLHCSMEDYCIAKGAKNNHAITGLSTVVMYELVDLLEAAFDSFCQSFERREEKTRQPEQQIFDDDPVVVMSFLPSVTASAVFASMFGGSFDVAQCVSGCPYLALWSLLVETRKEVPLFLAMGQLMIKFEPKTKKKLEKMKKNEGMLATALDAIGKDTGIDEEAASYTSRFGSPCAFGHTSLDSLSQYKIYRWCNYCLDLPESEPTQIIYWQIFFALYFAAAGGSRVFGHHFLDQSSRSNTKGMPLRKRLEIKLQTLVNYCSSQAQVVLTSTSGSGGRTSNGSNLATDLKERRYAHLVALSQLYAAMGAWVEGEDPNQWLKEDELSALPPHYEVDRLEDVLRLSDMLLNSDSGKMKWSDLSLWISWCGFEFTVRRSTLNVAVDDESGSASCSRLPSSPPLAAFGEEDGFAFVEETSELARRRGTFEGLAGPNGLDIRPLSPVSGPSHLTLLPTVSVVMLPDRCVVTESDPIDKAGLKAVAMKYSENLSVLVTLDAEMMESVAQLYVCKVRAVTQCLPCPEGSNCSSPAVCRFEFMEWAINSRADDAIKLIRAQGERCDMQSMLTTSGIPLPKEHDGQTHDEGSTTITSRTSVSAERFLQLDESEFMLSLQILLIDEVARTLIMERDELLQLKRTLRNEALLNAATPDDTLEGIEVGDVVVVSSSADADVLSPLQQIERDFDRLHEKGLEWFHLFTELDTKLSRMLPPLREALWRSIKQLGLHFVCVDERETCTLLQLMLEDPSRITLLSECFFPAALPLRFAEMFAKLMSASNSARLSSEEKLIVLHRFDFRAWLNAKSPQTPTKFDRDTVLCMILGDIGHHFSADRKLDGSAPEIQGANGCAQPDEMLRLYAEVLQLLCSTYLEDHIEKIVRALVGVHHDYRHQPSYVDSASPISFVDCTSSFMATALPRPMDPSVWEALIGVPLARWKKLSLMHIKACITFLSEHMTSLRWQGGLSAGSVSNGGAGENVVRGNELRNVMSIALVKYPIVYWQRLGVLRGLLDFFALCCRAAPDVQQWELITTFFEPLLSTLYQPATNQKGSGISAPWSEEDTLSTGTTVCSCFVAICAEYLKMQSAAGPTRDISQLSTIQSVKLSQIWSFYLSALVPRAPAYICKYFYQFLTRLAWEHWCLTLDTVQQMRELIQIEKQRLMGVVSVPTAQEVFTLHSTSSSYPYVSWLVRDILCRTTWRSTNSWLEAQSEAVRSSFLLEFAKLCLELVLDLPHFRFKSGHAVSTNVLPPYFVNFIKQQSAMWTNWRMTIEDLKMLLQFTSDAVMEPLRSQGDTKNLVVGGSLLTVPNVALMQDAFARLQLVLRLLSQITTLHHGKLSTRESLKRVNLFLNFVFSVFEVNDRGSLSNNAHTCEYAAWSMVLYGSSCASLYEKLDEIVHYYKVRASDKADVSEDGISEEDLTATISCVLRFCNLLLVEVFFNKMQDEGRLGCGGESSASSLSGLNWNKCGNVVLLEIDALVRDFASRLNTLEECEHDPLVHARNDKSANHTSISATEIPAKMIGMPLGKVLWAFLAFRGGELACMSACGRTLASVHVMSQATEKCIEKWIIEERRGMWDALALQLHVPELSGDEFEAACLEQGKLLTLLVLFLQQLRSAPLLTESLGLALLTKLMGWMERVRVGKTVLSQMKLLFLAAEMTNFVCKPLAEALPLTLKKQVLRQLCGLLLELGHARRNNGLMKAIGLGGSLQYGFEFHVSCLAAGVFLRLQTRHGAPLRVDDRIPFKVTRTTEKHLRFLETMLQSKDACRLGGRADALLDLSRDPRRSLADQDEFFVSLFSGMYPAQGWLLAKCLP
uniref:Ectopic P granules protein 5 n=1 Tax=Hyaloperonospora arabidopsidis (strain Emoy2) TaxID=559515 RepID=M4B3S9_HYAAE